ncbi:MAG: ATP-dependent ligase LigD phosphoesterase module / ATP-dependent ligase LigD polymerase [Candidatus Nomurabacteria bacterium]|nr:ATP-dependent ligase LigD phosphoesterase module / ATP-dependent ligase LigD polymerase [Candidatus Nomurabacteria bacterium]
MNKITKIKPMLATLANAPFDSEDYIYEIKLDGYRALAEVNERKVDLYSRNLKSFTEKYPDIVNLLKKVKENVLFDGEIVAYDKSGNASFQSLQNMESNKDIKIEYVIFDLLYFEGKNIMYKPLLERKDILENILKKYPKLTYSSHVKGKGKELFKQAVSKNLEGIMAKEINSKYTPNKRSESWLKIKHHQGDEAIIAGFTEPKGSRSYFGSLVLGQYKDNGEFTFVGHTGTGFNQTILKDLYSQMKTLKVSNSPFKSKVPLNSPITWIKPSLIAQIKFAEWTGGGIMRQPVYLGLREDKKIREVKKEKVKIMKTKTIKSNNIKQKAELTHLDKVYFPKGNVTKGDVINYYEKISPIILKYLKDRPESLNRHPNGVGKPNFFQKNVTGELPPFVSTYKRTADSTKEDVNYIVCQNKETLLYMANLGCIEINPWNSRIAKPDYPDWMVIDLDPGENTLDELIKVAQEVKKVLDMSCEKSYVKTSGKTGIHIFVPLGAKYPFEQVKNFSELLVKIVNKKLPEITSLERSPAKRKKKIYLDYLQNNIGQTIAAPYSLRPTEDATVSTPLKWAEVKKGLNPKKFTIKTIFKRIHKYGDVWEGILKDKVDLKKAITCLEKSKELI